MTTTPGRATSVPNAESVSANSYMGEAVDEEIVEKTGEVKELAKVLYLDGDLSEKKLKDAYAKLAAVKMTLLKADKKYDAKRERG